MPLSKRNDPVETLAANRQHEPLRERVQVWAPRRKPHHLGPCSREHLPKLPRVQWVTGHEEVPRSSQEASHRIEEITRHLVHPEPVWLAADPGDIDLPDPSVDYEDD